MVHRWPGYDVAFADHTRRLATPYACITSARLADAVARSLAAPGSRLVLDARAVDVAARCVRYDTADGGHHELSADVVIDARGPEASSATDCGWQKFVGQELVLRSPHGLERPLIMDATVAQQDGFRFVYTLPLTPGRVLVEDTYFADRPELDRDAIAARIAAYVAQRGWSIAEIVREESGVLPLPWRAQPPSALRPLLAGYAGGWFHPVTGYSLPIAARLAEVIGTHDPDALDDAVDLLARSHARRLRFACTLNHMLFHWFSPGDRHRVLAWFYRQPEELIQRFYALELTAADLPRFLLRRPPGGLSLRRMLGGGLA